MIPDKISIRLATNTSEMQVRDGETGTPVRDVKRFILDADAAAGLVFASVVYYNTDASVYPGFPLVEQSYRLVNQDSDGLLHFVAVEQESQA